VTTVGTAIWVASDTDFLFTFRNKKSEEQSRRERVLLCQDEPPFWSCQRYHVCNNCGNAISRQIGPEAERPWHYRLADNAFCPTHLSSVIHCSVMQNGAPSLTSITTEQQMAFWRRGKYLGI